MLDTMQTAASVKPTLTDHDVLQFCKTGFLVLEGVIPDSTNRWVFEYLDREDAPESALAKHERFIAEVLLHPAVAGVARSLLGEGFALPEKLPNHRLVGPTPAGRWHMDGGALFERTCTHVYAFYIPQTNTKEMGPTYFLPGSHLVPISREEMQHFGHLAGQIQTNGPAGSVFFTHQSIWHRQAVKTDQSVRNLLKWSYWRTVPPKRDWIADPDFRFSRADFSLDSEYFAGPARKWQSVPRVAEMFTWMCGKSDNFQWFGGSGWPYGGSPDVILEKQSWMPDRD